MTRILKDVARLSNAPQPGLLRGAYDSFKLPWLETTSAIMIRFAPRSKQTRTILNKKHKLSDEVFDMHSGSYDFGSCVGFTAGYLSMGGAVLAIGTLAAYPIIKILRK